MIISYNFKSTVSIAVGLRDSPADNAEHSIPSQDGPLFCDVVDGPGYFYTPELLSVK